MTPFELRLSNELDVEWQRFDSEWLFQWHNIKSERRNVDVPDYRGGRITLGGIRFGGQQQSIYWQALGRYLNGKVHEIFDRWDQQTKSYPPGLRRSSLDGTENLLRTFVARVMERANSTDQALRGDGTPRTDKSAEGSATHSRANVEILRLAKAHRELFPAVVPDVPQSVGRRLMDALNLKPGLWGMSIDLKALFARRKR
jgi:hypothetical protein